MTAPELYRASPTNPLVTNKLETKTEQVRSKGAGTIEGLHAEGPDPQLREKLMLFGRFVGDWDIIQDRYLLPDGRWVEQKGEVHWGWILDGKAVQDVWTSIDEKTGKSIAEGTTVRFYDPDIDAWHSVWIAPPQGAVKTFIGRQVGNETVLEGRTKDGHPLKWIFSEITEDSFRWHAEETWDNGETWTLTEEMTIRKRR